MDNFKLCLPHWELKGVEVDLHLSLSNNNNNNHHPPLTMHFSLERSGLNWCVSGLSCSSSTGSWRYSGCFPSVWPFIAA